MTMFVSLYKHSLVQIEINADYISELWSSKWTFCCHGQLCLKISSLQEGIPMYSLEIMLLNWLRREHIEREHIEQL